MLPSQRPKFSDPIEYAPTSDAQERRARLNRFTKLTLTAALAAVAIAWGWRFTKQLQYLYWQHQCMTFTAPMKTVVYSDGIKYLPACAANFLPNRVADSYAFLHARKNNSGDARLVAVAIDRGYVGLAFVGTSYIPASVRPKSVLADEVSTVTPFDSGAHTKVLAGQIDAQDESHFTIEVVDGDQSQIYDGWLGDDGRVTIEPRRK